MSVKHSIIAGRLLTVSYSKESNTPLKTKEKGANSSIVWNTELPLTRGRNPLEKVRIIILLLKRSKTVNHQMLLSKQNTYSINIHSLEQRKQFCVIKCPDYRMDPQGTQFFSFPRPVQISLHPTFYFAINFNKS